MLGLAACVRLFRFSLEYSADFEVYWRAVQAWAAGESPYAVQGAAAGFVFKYPPWLLAAFFPLAWLPLAWAKGLWAAISLGATVSISRWLLRAGVALWPLLGTLACFWWIWLGHFWAGQISLAMLAIALGAQGARQAIWRGGMVFAMTAKVFSVYPLLGAGRRFFTRATIASFAGWMAAAHLVLIAPVVLVTKGEGISFGSELAGRLLGFYSGWFQAAASGGAELGVEVVRGQANHGFPALLLRALGVSATQSRADLLAFLFFGISLGLVWARCSRSLIEAERWAGWLALGVIVHPLAWHHSFVFAFPLAAFAVDRALRSGSRARSWKPLALAALGIACIALVIPQVVGTELVKPFELAGSKAWGVVLTAWALLSARAQLEKAVVS